MKKISADVVVISPETLKTWRSPPFQRPIRITAKVEALVDQVKADGGVLPGIITLGVVDRAIYIVDGQHRAEAFRLSGLTEGMATVRTVACRSMAELGEEFVHLNTHLVALRPDDILRGLEASLRPLQVLRERCRFVGYDMIRRSDKAPLLSMSVVLRMWRGSSTEVPANNGGAAAIAGSFTVDEAEACAGFLNVCFKAWGRDPEYAKLWGALNLILCAWLYRRIVLTRYSAKTVPISGEQFCRALMSVSADPNYVDWLVGRNLGERDRSPAYQRLKSIIAGRLAQEIGKRPALPAPAWTND